MHVHEVTHPIVGQARHVVGFGQFNKAVTKAKAQRARVGDGDRRFFEFLSLKIHQGADLGILEEGLEKDDAALVLAEFVSSFVPPLQTLYDAMQVFGDEKFMQID